MTADSHRPDAHRAPLQKHLRTTSRKFLTALLAGLLLALPPLPAAPREDTAPALSVGKVVGSPQVVRGGAGEIILRGIAMPGDSVEFKIQKKPAHGSLQGPRRIDRETVAYTYQHDGEKDHSSDRILFKLKTGPDKTWGTLQAEIAIEEPPPGMELENPELDFGAVPIGASRTLPLVLLNVGGGALEGTIEVAAPWMLDGPSTFQLAESGTLPLKITFNPDGPGLRKGRLSVAAGGLQQSAILIGEGTYRFDSPARIAFGKTAGADQFDLPLSNTTGAPLRLAVSAPPPLQCKPEITLPPNGSAILPLALEKRHYTEKSVTLSLADGNAVRTIRVDLPPPPALLQWDAPEGAIDLGEIALRHIPRKEFQLANRGSTTALVELRGGGGGLVPDPEQPLTFELPPGGEAKVKTVWRLAGDTGPASGSIIASHGGLEHTLRVVARIVEAETPEEKNPKPPSQAEASPTPATPHVLSPQEQATLADRLPSDFEYRLESAWPIANAFVSWTRPARGPVDFQIEVLRPTRAGLIDANPFQDRLQIPGEIPTPELRDKWTPISPTDAEVRKLPDGRWQARVPDLAPGFHRIRVVATEPGSKRADGAELIVEVGKIPLPASLPWILLGLLFISLAYLLRKRLPRL
jgi:hypothetical protein